ncbi:hypothetical protein NHQ30_008464 [Ciborinia camelliae]|nr:hypothetical protein NHQ30_008464 [Ciborinia camelliae]
MKILCLHGWGTSGSILQQQSAVLRRFCDETYEFIFLDGEVHCQAAKGLDSADGPFLCYYNSFTPSEIAKACLMIDGVIEDRGPFDAILGFSQGGSLALTYLLRHTIETPDIAPPFRFAILCSTVVGFAPWTWFGQEILHDLHDDDFETLETFPVCDFAKLDGKKRIMCESLSRVFEIARKGGFIEIDTPGGSFPKNSTHEHLPRVMHPQLLSEAEKVQIPTIHVTGAKDDRGMVELSNLMMGCCNLSEVQKLVHPGGHDLPKDVKNARLLARAIESANERSLRLRFMKI